MHGNMNMDVAPKLCTLHTVIYWSQADFSESNEESLCMLRNTMQGRILVEIVGEVEKFRGGAAV